MKQCGLIVALGIAVCAGTVALYAHGGATGIVRERMDSMVLIGKSMKALSAFVRGQRELNQSEISAAGQAIADQAGSALLAQFPAGSLSAASEARPEIWQDFQSFTALANELQTAAQAVAAWQPGDGLQPLTSNFNRMAKTCQSCHKQFRVKK